MAWLKMKDGESLLKYCKRTGISYSSVWQIIDNEGLTPEEAVEEYKKRKLKPTHLYYIGKTPLTYVCRELGVLASSVQNRIARTGESEAEALVMILIDKKHKG